MYVASEQEILNAIIPPREYNADGVDYVQSVSYNSASREDVANLQKLLDQRLGVRQARYHRPLG
jgi:dynein light intermediate chain